MDRARLAVILTALLILGGVAVAILLARGYQIDITNRTLSQTGILVTTSDPDGAEVYINDVLTTATNNTLNLAPGTYNVSIRKDGFSRWEKTIPIVKEEVFKTNAFLFPLVPDLGPITYSGALNPTLSPDGSRVAFSVASASGEKNGIWVLDMGRGVLVAPLISGANQRQIYQNTAALNLSGAKFLWSNDSRQILVYTDDKAPTLATPSAKPVYLLEADQLNITARQVNAEQKDLLSSWKEGQLSVEQAQMNRLPLVLKTILASSASEIKFSVDETKVLYHATASASLPTILNTYLPGKNPTPETRETAPGKVYMYDIKEDQNYQIDYCSETGVTCTWFPSSRHILAYTDKDVSLIDFDGTNRNVVYEGPFIPGIVYSWPDWSKIVLLTSLNALAGGTVNLYTLKLR